MTLKQRLSVTKDSIGLNYNDGLIHHTYGARVKDLEKAIRAELGAF